MRFAELLNSRIKGKSKIIPIVLLACVALMMFNADYLFYMDLEFHYANRIDRVEGKKYKIGYFVFKNSIGDLESAKQKCIAGQNLGWDCYILSYPGILGSYWVSSKFLYAITSVLNYFFKPDFLVHTFPSDYEIASSKFPSYAVMSYDMTGNIKDKKTPWNNIGNYDGYIAYTPTYDWFTKLNPKSITNNSVPSNFKIFISHMHSTVSKTIFVPLEYKQLFYCGDNWDKLRSSAHYKEILKTLSDHDHLEVFGPVRSWDYLTKGYKGYLPHDGISLMKKIRELGIVLILHSQQHMDSATPTSRIFESAAASALIISDLHPFVQKEFGDCVLYIDPKKPVAEVVDTIEGYIKWAQENNGEAEKKAKCAHEIFIEKFTLEEDVLNMVDMHEKVLKEKAMKFQ